MTRAAIVEWARGEVGPDTHEKRVRYWTSALGRPVTYAEVASLAWCGGFALCALHEGGVGIDIRWVIGKGFLLQPPRPLPVVTVPKPGDIGYQDKPFAHHFVVDSVEGSLVHTIEGNQPDVRRKTRSLTPAVTYYSIDPLLALTAAGNALTSPGSLVLRHTTAAEVQHAVNNLIMKHVQDLAVPSLLTVDGRIGPKSAAAIAWAQGVLGIHQTGNPDAATCEALGL